jgi:elongation factor G
MEPRGPGVQALRARVPMAEMFGYATELRSMTQGRGTFTMEFYHYDKVSDEIEKRILSGWRR